MLNELLRVVEKLISPEEIARLPEQLQMSPAEALDYWRLQVPCYLADPGCEKQYEAYSAEYNRLRGVIVGCISENLAKGVKALRDEIEGLSEKLVEDFETLRDLIEGLYLRVAYRSGLRDGMRLMLFMIAGDHGVRADHGEWENISLRRLLGQLQEESAARAETGRMDVSGPVRSGELVKDQAG
ncbi:MAG: hypothetical protein ACUVSK_09685 [Desulfotomaculales bacterium]